MIEDLHEGLCRVSTEAFYPDDIDYWMDYDESAGIWGYVNADGEEVIAPQYTYAEDFMDGIAIVANGTWKYTDFIESEHTEESKRPKLKKAVWGAINKEGRAVIPMVFDEIRLLDEDDELYSVCLKGEKRLWGIMNRYGSWVVEPVFEFIGYLYHDGLVNFYRVDLSVEPDNVLYGVYDIKQQKVIFEPQFLDIHFLDDGGIKVSVFDAEVGRKIEKIIDRNGKEIQSCM